MDTINSKKYVIIGGGTGSFVLLSGLKHYTKNITALVSMADDGGSTGVLRDEYGVLPPGDVRQCLVALSNSSQEMRELFNFRFGEGTLNGHSFGNLFLAAVEKMTNNFADATRLAEEVLNITGRVVPITLDNTRLVLNGGKNEVVGQHRIDNTVTHHMAKPQFELRPNAKINPEAKQAILQADVVILAPGSLYGSLISSLIVDGVKDALQHTNAKIIQVINLVNKPGQTDNWSVADYYKEFGRFVGPDTVDYVLYNTKKPSPEMLAIYAKAGEFPVIINDNFDDLRCKVIGKDLLSYDLPNIAGNDKLAPERTLIRHNPLELARAILGLNVTI